MPELARTVEALLFLSSDPLTVAELADATQTGEGAVRAALELLAGEYAPGRHGLRLRELAGGWTFASDPDSEDAARRLFSRPRTATLTPAQAETLAIVAYLQPVSRPEITRIRGVSADSATATLLERGLIEEAGHSQFGAVFYRTGTQFLKLFGLAEPAGPARHRAVGPDPAGAAPSSANACCVPARRGPETHRKVETRQIAARPRARPAGRRRRRCPARASGARSQACRARREPRGRRRSSRG